MPLQDPNSGRFVAQGGGIIPHNDLHGHSQDLLKRRIAATVSMVQALSGPAESYMKENASWTDRTANARNGLAANADIQGTGLFTRVGLTLSHGVSYGIWLELANAGKYAIVGPTAQKYRAIVRGYIKRIWNSGGGPTAVAK